MNVVFRAFIEAYGTHGATLILFQASAIVRKENERLADEVDQIAKFLREAAEVEKR